MRYAAPVSKLLVGIEVAVVRAVVPVVDVSKDSGPYKRAAFRCQASETAWDTNSSTHLKASESLAGILPHVDPTHCSIVPTASMRAGVVEPTFEEEVRIRWPNPRKHAHVVIFSF